MWRSATQGGVRRRRPQIPLQTRSSNPGQLLNSYLTGCQLRIYLYSAQIQRNMTLSDRQHRAQTPHINITADAGMEACTRTGVEKDGLGRVAQALAVGGHAKEVAHKAPEGGPFGIALREVEGARPCAIAANV